MRSVARFALPDHLARWSNTGGPLEALVRLVNFEQFRELPEQAPGYANGSMGGRRHAALPPAAGIGLVQAWLGRASIATICLNDRRVRTQGKPEVPDQVLTVSAKRQGTRMSSED